MIKIIKAQRSWQYFQAEEFLEQNEKYHLSLMQRIQKKEDSIFLVYKISVFSKPELKGVFSYTKGKNFAPYFPDFNSEIKNQLKYFFKKNKIFCLFGDSKETAQIEKLICANSEKEVREMFLMEFSPEKNQLVNDTEVFKCTPVELNSLLPLHLNFSREETYPYWKEVNAAAEGMNLSLIIKNFSIYAIKYDGKIVAKAHTNCETEHFVQIGGVYTVKEFRGKGMAASLVNKIGNTSLEKNKRCILFVRKNNQAAIHCYEKAGFKIFSECRMIYFKT